MVVTSQQEKGASRKIGQGTKFRWKLEKYANEKTRQKKRRCIYKTDTTINVYARAAEGRTLNKALKSNQTKFWSVKCPRPPVCALLCFGKRCCQL